MTKHTLKISLCTTLRFLKKIWPFFNIRQEKVNQNDQTRYFIKAATSGVFQDPLRQLR